LRASDLIPSLTGKVGRALYPVATGLAVFLAYPVLTSSQQDVASIAPVPIEQRWQAHVREKPGETVASTDALAGAALASVSGADLLVTGSVERSIDGGDVASRVEVGVRRERAAQRVNRDMMGGRVVSATIARPPAYFSAGSVLQRQSFLDNLDLGDKLELAFVEPRPVKEAYEVAAALHTPEPPRPLVDPEMPVQLASLVVESADHVLAYGQEPEVLRSPFAAVLAEEERPIELLPVLGKDDHAWADDPLPLSVFSDREQHCLSAGVYFEARGEPVRGQAAVAQVILNRVRNPTYPNSICGVVYQNKDWRNRCQFSFACDRIKDRVSDPKRWRTAEMVSRSVTEGRIWLPEVGSSTHYHATYVNPRWASSMKKVSKIGLHIFYRTRGGGWS
jgi:spore germination cell wall hydrolase CwlJ-like protein